MTIKEVKNMDFFDYYDLQWSIISQINFQPYIQKCSSTLDIMNSVQEDYYNNKLDKELIAQIKNKLSGDVFAFTDPIEFNSYLSRIYGWFSISCSGLNIKTYNV